MTRNDYTLYIFISVFAIQQCATTFRLSVQKYHFLIATYDLEVCNSERNQQKKHHVRSMALPTAPVNEVYVSPSRLED